MEFVLKGATLALQVDEVSSYWVKGDRFVLCDELDRRTTVHQALPLSPVDSVATYAVSSDLLGGQATRSAGGIVPSGSEERLRRGLHLPGRPHRARHARPLTTRDAPGGGWSTCTTTEAAASSTSPRSR